MRNQRLNLRAGEWVEVRSKEAILSTLDAGARLDRLPFMPEMFAYCGHRFKVSGRAHKTCDTVNRTGGRRLTASVHLDGVRCDGAAHGGCQAACLIFWKEAWLQRVAGPPPTHAIASDCISADSGADSIAGEACVWDATRVPAETEGAEITYVCQATTLPEFTTLLPWWDVRQYIEDYTSGNVTLWQLMRGGAYVGFHHFVNRVGRYSPKASWRMVLLYDRLQAAVNGVPYPRKWGKVPPGEKTPRRPLPVKVGDLIRVRTYEEILETLDKNNRNRGMYFDAEEVPYCGKTYRVRSAVSRIIDERTGRMLTFKNPSLILEGVICQARYSDRRMFCPRAIYSFWRETWLQPADAALALERSPSTSPNAIGEPSAR
jgi:hypothetical protein